MWEDDCGILPVVKEGRLVGVLTERDFMDIAAELLVGRERALGTERRRESGDRRKKKESFCHR